VKVSRDQIQFLIRYAVVGAFGACFYAGSYCGLVALTDGKSVISSLIAYAVAVVVQYYSHAHFSFGVSAHDKNQAAKFILVTIAGFLLSTLIAFIGPRLGWASVAVAFTVVVTVPLFNLAAFSSWVFKKDNVSTTGILPNS